MTGCRIPNEQRDNELETENKESLKQSELLLVKQNNREKMELMLLHERKEKDLTSANETHLRNPSSGPCPRGFAFRGH